MSLRGRPYAVMHRQAARYVDKYPEGRETRRAADRAAGAILSSSLTSSAPKRSASAFPQPLLARADEVIE